MPLNKHTFEQLEEMSKNILPPPDDIDETSKKYWEQIWHSAWKSIIAPGGTGKELIKQEGSSESNYIYVFRHGQSMDNLRRIFSGWRDARLSKDGIEGAEILAEKLKNQKIDLCFVSHLQRSKNTARIGLKHFRGLPHIKDDRIIERNYGTLQGMSKIKLTINQPSLGVAYRRGYDYAPPKGESLKMVEERVFPFCDELVQKVKKEKINVALSAHGNSMKAIRRYFEKFDVLEEMVLENPLAKDYARYVV